MKESLKCDVDVIHKDIVANTQASAMTPKDIASAAMVAGRLSDPTRLGIIVMLDIHEQCVCDLAVLLNKTKSVVSHQLKILRDTGVVRMRKSGKIAYYSLVDPTTRQYLSIMKLLSSTKGAR